jgi:hypothetical protein
MSSAARILKVVIRASGALALLMGLAIWGGYLIAWIPVHMAFGVILVLSLVGASGLALRAGVRPGFAAFVALWGIGIVWFGRMQMGLMPGPHHWIIRLTHLLAGGVAMGLGTALATALEGAAPRNR